MERNSRSNPIAAPNVLWLGLFCVLVSLLQLYVFRRPDFYTLFSVGATIVFLNAHDRLAERPLFAGWNGYTWSVFLVALLLFCVIIDQTGMRLGYWRYPHYDGVDEVRKYVFEWAVALLYHMVAYRAGAVALWRLGVPQRLAAAVSMVVGVTLVGLMTEGLNVFVSSWEVLSMPISNAQLGPFFVVFQTVGYWLMVVFPYAIYLVVDGVAVSERAEQTNYHEQQAGSADRMRHSS